MKAYHFLNADMTANSGNEPPWRVGETRRMPRGAPIVLCESGYHSSPTPWDALQYASGPILCLVDVSRPRHKDASKLVSSRRTLVEAVDATRTLHEIAVRIALDVLPIYESQYPADKRPRLAIEAKRAWLRGQISAAQLKAARAAAEAAAGVAGAAAWAAWAAAGVAAGAAARVAAEAAAGVAAGAAARVAAARAKYAAWGNEMLVAALTALADELRLALARQREVNETLVKALERLLACKWVRDTASIEVDQALAALAAAALDQS